MFVGLEAAKKRARKTVQTTPLPGTAFGTGLHPLISRGRRHFCTKGLITYVNSREYTRITPLIVVFHGLIIVFPGAGLQ